MPEIGLGIFRPLYYSPDLLWRWKAGWAGGSFSRASEAWHIGPDGLIHQAASGVPRIEWYDLDGDGVRETPTVLLEPAATNLLLHSEDFSHSVWDKNTGAVIVTPNVATAPDGTATADLVQDNPASSNAVWMLQTVTGATSAGATYTFSCWLRSASGGPDTVRLAFWDNAGGWQQSAVTVTSEWRRYSLTRAFDAASTVRRVGFGPSDAFSPAGALVWGAQLEAGPVATSYVPTTASTASRSADALTFPWAHAPQPMTGYLRFVERGAAQPTRSSVLLQIGQLGQAPRLFVYHPTGAAGYQVILALTSGTAGSGLTTGPVIGDRVELLWRLYADGSVRIEQSINGGTPTVAARSSAIGLPTAWSGQILRLSGVPNFSGNEGPAAWRDALICKGTDITWDEVRALVGA